MTTVCRWVLVLGLVPAATHAGSVLVVDDTPGPGVQFSDIAPAVAAASDGDLILVKSGTYSGFDIHHRSLSVVADIGAMVEIVGRVQVSALAAANRALLRGLKVRSAPELGGGFLDPNFDYSAGLQLLNSTGVTWVEDCTIDGFYSCIEATAAKANLTRVVLTAQAPFPVGRGRTPPSRGHSARPATPREMAATGSFSSALRRSCAVSLRA